MSANDLGTILFTVQPVTVTDLNPFGTAGIYVPLKVKGQSRPMTFFLKMEKKSGIFFICFCFGHAALILYCHRPTCNLA